MSNTLHNRLMADYEAITHYSRDEAFVRRDVANMRQMLEHWTRALDAALAGDGDTVRQQLTAAFDTAMLADKQACQRPRHKAQAPAVVRFREVEK